MRWLAAALALLVLPASSLARPVTKAFDLKAGKEEFARAFLKAAASDDPAVATAELLPSNEVLITALKPGRALLLLVGEANLETLRIRVFAPEGKAPEVRATEEQRAAARKACPGYKEEGPEGSKTVTVAVSSPACRGALRELFAGDEYSTRRLDVSFAPEAILDQLSAIKAGLKAKGLEGAIQVTYAGASLQLKGKATAAQKLEALKVVFDAAVGPVLFEDGIEPVEEKKKEKDKP